jgi:UDPglucose 6-dehydrogenase
MTNIGWVGLGKLGLPCALTLTNLAEVQHEVFAYDVDPYLEQRVQSKNPYEARLSDLSRNNLHISPDVTSVVSNSDGVVFLAVQTPHEASYGGENYMPDEKKDFEYKYLRAAAAEISSAAEDLNKDITLVVVSTVLPGTMREYIFPVLSPRVNLVYNPFFIAMGTTVNDFSNPEFVLTGVDDPSHVEPVKDLYATLHSKPVQVLSIESAELTKVAYNCFISMKVVFANTIMEICHKTDADCDEVIDSLSLATDRVISPAYMRGGMGDGGSCHPRDNIAMSWLAEKLHLSADPFYFVSLARETQARWIADLIMEAQSATGLDVVILGKAYKPESNLSNGSPALLVYNVLHLLRRNNIRIQDHHVDGTAILTDCPAVFLIGTKHKQYASQSFPAGSYVIDPFGYIADQPKVTVVRIGRKSRRV